MAPSSQRVPTPAGSAGGGGAGGSADAASGWRRLRRGEWGGPRSLDSDQGFV